MRPLIKNPMRRPVGEAAPFDWALLAGLIILGSSSFTLIRASIDTIPPAVVSVGRLWIAAIALYVFMRAKGRRFPSLLVRTNGGWRPHRLWVWMAAIGFVGYAAPFLIFPWAQQYVESGLAGVYMAFMPIWTLGLAYLFTDEKMTPSKAIGFALGAAGVMILLGPEAGQGVASSSILAQIGLLVATLLYAASAVMSRRAPPARPRTFSAGIVLMGAIFSTPALLLTPLSPSAWSLHSALSIIALGVGPTALAGVIIITIIRRVGASFMALANYIVPVCAVIAGAVLFKERLDPTVFIALAVILTGVAVSQRRTRPVIETGDALAADLDPMVDRGRSNSQN